MTFNGESSTRECSLMKFGTRYVQILLVFLGVAITCAGRYSISVAVVAMTDAKAANPDYPEFDWDSQIKSYVLSSFFWGYVIMQIPSGYVANIYSAYKLVSCGVCISSLLNILTPLLAIHFNWEGAVCCRIMMGLTQSCLIPSLHTFISRWVPTEEKARLGSFVMVAPQFGNIICLTISGWLASSSLGWPSIFYVFGGLGILWSVIFYYFGADSPASHKRISSDEKAYIENSLNSMENSGKKKLRVPWKSIFTSIPVWTLILTHCGQSWGFYIFLTKMPAYIKYILKFDVGESGVISALPYIVMCFLIIPVGWICDFALKKGISLGIIRKVSNSIGMWGAAIALIILCLVQTNSSIVPLLILCMVVGLDAANLCGFHINHIDLAPNFAGTQIAILNTVGNLFAQFAPIACGFIVTDEANVNQWHVIFYITAGMYFLSNLIFVVFGECKTQPWNNLDKSSDKPNLQNTNVNAEQTL